MAEKHEIELFISDDGELKVHIKGIKGKSCLKIVDALSEGTGQEKQRNLTGEYYEVPKTGSSSTMNIKKTN